MGDQSRAVPANNAVERACHSRWLLLLSPFCHRRRDFGPTFDVLWTTTPDLNNRSRLHERRTRTRRIRQIDHHLELLSQSHHMSIGHIHFWWYLRCAVFERIYPNAVQPQRARQSTWWRSVWKALLCWLSTLLMQSRKQLEQRNSIWPQSWTNLSWTNRVGLLNISTFYEYFAEFMITVHYTISDCVRLEA